MNELSQAVLAQDWERVLHCVRRGDSVNVRPRDWGEPLLCALASTCPDLRVLQAVREAGADLDEPSWFGDSPLHFACHYGHLETVQWFVAAGAREDVLDQNGQTPRDVAWSALLREGVSLPPSRGRILRLGRLQNVVDWLDSPRGCGLK